MDLSLEDTVDCNAWNYHPDVPIEQGGIFQRFWDPLFVLKGIILSWFGLYIRGIFLATITILWLTVLPTMESVFAGNWSWIAQTLAVNLTLMLAWAGSLHLYLHTFGVWVSSMCS